MADLRRAFADRQMAADPPCDRDKMHLRRAALMAWVTEKLDAGIGDHPALDALYLEEHQPAQPPEPEKKSKKSKK